MFKMSNFICEERPSSRRPRPMMPLDGFVAELRPRFRPELVAVDSSISEEKALKVSSYTHDDQVTYQSLGKVLSHKSDKQITDILTSSVMTLVQTILTGRDIAAIEGSLKVSFHGIEHPIQVKLNEVFPLAKNDPFLHVGKNVDIKYREQQSPPLEMNWDDDQYLYDNQLSPDLLNRDEISSIGSSPPRTEQMMSDYDKESVLTPGDAEGLMTRSVSPVRNPEIAVVSPSDSGEESGYTSNDHDDLSSSHGDRSPMRVMVDEGNTIGKYDLGETVCSEETSELDDDMERPLVIDVIYSAGGSDSVQTDADLNRNLEVRQSYNISPVHQNEVTSSSSDDGEYNLSLTRLDDTDSDFPMDLSGDCKIIADSKSVLKENGKEVESPSLLLSVKCQLCVDTFPDVAALCKHVAREHQAYMCQHCSRLFTAKNNLKRHIRIHTGLKPYKCPQCPTTFARRDDLKGHLLRHDYNKPYRCSICKKGYTDRVCVKNHMVKEHGSRLMFVCPQCGESFDQEDYFSAHKKTHPELNRYACDICPFIGSNNLMACKHSLVHTRRLFSCKPCNAYFADPFGYTDHIRRHKKNEKFIHYVCCFCDIELPSYEQFIRHEYSHAHYKTYTCHLCNKQFRSKPALQEHALNQHEYSNSACDEKQNDDVSIERVKTNTASFDEKYCEDLTEVGNSKEDEKDHSRIGLQEGALDLTVKRPMTSAMNIPCVTSDHSFSKGQEKISNFDVPRNGCVTEFSCPREEERVLSQMEMTPPTISAAGAVDKLEDNNWNVALDVDNGHKKSDLPRKYTHSTTGRLFNQLNGQCRFTPYPLPAKAAELATKYFLARGQSPFVHASATNNIRKDVRFPFEKKELVIEKDSTGKASIHIVSQTSSQGHVSTSVGEQIDGKENNFCKMLPSKNDFEQNQTPNVFYGLTGKEYRKDNHISTSLPAGGSSLFPTSVKQEPMDQDDFSVKPNLAEKAREPLVPPISMAATKIQVAGHNCDTCSQVFECFSQLESHSVLTHKRYMCEYCNKAFTSRPNRDRHVRYHTGEKPYKCDLCDTAFHRGDDLKYHRTTRHPEATPFVCSRCSATFTWKRDLDRHVRHSKCKS